MGSKTSVAIIGPAFPTATCNHTSTLFTAAQAKAQDLDRSELRRIATQGQGLGRHSCRLPPRWPPRRGSVLRPAGPETRPVGRI